MPGMYAVTSCWLDRRTRAILRSAEFGFLGVIVRTWRQTPRFCGAPGMDTWRCFRLFQFLRIAGALIFWILGRRPCRTSWLIVGTKTLLLSVGLSVAGGVEHRGSAWPGSTTPAGTGCPLSRDGPEGPPGERAERETRLSHERGVYQSATSSVKRVTAARERIPGPPPGSACESRR